MTVIDKINFLISKLEEFDSSPNWLKIRTRIEVDNHWMLPGYKNKIEYEDGSTFLRWTIRFKNVLEGNARDYRMDEKFPSKEDIQAEMRRCNRLWKKIKRDFRSG